MSATQSSARPPKSGAEYKIWNEERKARKRKWKEEKLMKDFEEQRAAKQTAGVASEIPISAKSDGAKALTEDIAKCSHTVSIAVPGSILDNAQSAELRTYLVGQIARAAVVFNVDEIVVFEETIRNPRTTSVMIERKASVQMARVLQYLECPQYLRKCFFPQHKDLEFAGLLNPLASPHHMSQSDETEYREGVVLNKPVKDGRGSFVNVGLMKEIQIDKQLQAGLRVTVKMDRLIPGQKRKGHVVSPTMPRTQSGIYWGYTTRLAASLSAVFTESPYSGGYDVIVGTSERGTDVDSFVVPQFKHLLVVFGGLDGLEACVESDENLHVSDARLLFHHYLNTCPRQGSNTIRTEEAILITLSALRPKISQTATVQSATS